MAVLGVVPSKECLAMAPGVFDAAKALREVAAVFHGLELRLRIGVVIRGVGAAVALGHIKVNQQTGHRLGSHGSPALMATSNSPAFGQSNSPRQDSQIISLLV